MQVSSEDSHTQGASVESDPGPDTSEVAAEPNAQASAQLDAL